VTWLGCLIGAIACLPFSSELIEGVLDAPDSAVIGVLYLGAVPTALAFSTWAYALARMPAGELGVTTYVVPALVVLFGWLLLAEIPVPLAIIGGVVCLLGVAVSRKPTRTPL
jgi:drug/metabolite transporter (DMT)-like permease